VSVLRGGQWFDMGLARVGTPLLMLLTLSRRRNGVPFQDGFCRDRQVHGQVDMPKKEGGYVALDRRDPFRQAPDLGEVMVPNDEGVLHGGARSHESLAP